METKKLGSSSLNVSPICLGANVFGWTINEKTSFEILDAFKDKGFNFIDTADIYSRWASGVGGESETIIGNWMKKRNNRKDVIIATKAGMDMEGKYGGTNISKKYILRSAEASLKRLQTDHIDLYQTHRDDETLPVEETLEAHAQLIKEGKVRYIGASNFSAKRLEEAILSSQKNNLPRYQTLQPLYNLYDRAVFEKELEPVCLKHNISVINFYSLAAGFFSGKYRTAEDLKKSVRGAKVKDYLNTRGLKILDAVEEIARQHKVTSSTIAVAWLMQQPAIAAPIASATTIQQLNEILMAAEITLSEKEVAVLNEASNY